MNTIPFAIKLVNVTKTYSLHHEKPTLVERIFYNKNDKFTALNNINLTIKKGEKIGIIGPNGSGKTTLLKIITGIANPIKGLVKINGKVVSLIDLEAGFHPELTGLKNIYLNGIVLGMSSSQIKSRIDKIISFADIGKFMDVPFFTYSQGMKLRLAFSVAIHSDSDILILDESLSVGDQKFTKKCFAKINDFYKSGKTIIIVSHDLGYISKNCDRVILIKDGKIVKNGSSAKVIAVYKNEKY